MKRAKPKGADWHDWKAFERWADREGIGYKKSEWEPWWLCWKAGYNAAMSVP